MTQLITQIITLDPHSDRTQALIASLRAQGVDAHCFAAVDGRSSTPPLLPGEMLDQRRAVQQRLVPLTNSEIGCYLSHLRAVRQAFDDGADYLCLLEDDIQIEPAFATVLHDLLNLAESREFVRFMGLKRHRRKVVATLASGFRLTRPVKGLCGTQGYLLNRTGMAKVLAGGSVITKPIDKFYDHFWEIDLHAYCIEPHIVWEQNAASSVAKPFADAARASLVQRLIYKFNKVMRSVRRKIYVWSRWSAFYPGKKPATAQGKTARIR